jgi:hypothetical protein
MKSEQEFLAGVWNHIVNLEAEEREKAAARRRNRTLQIRRAAVLAGALLLFLALAAILLLADGKQLMEAANGWGLYGLAGCLLLGGYLAESRAALPMHNHERKGLHQ